MVLLNKKDVILVYLRWNTKLAFSH